MGIIFYSADVCHKNIFITHKMGPKKKQKLDKGNDEQSTNLIWTDDEVQILLETIRDFKSKKSYEGIDWESVKEKYDLVLSLFLEGIPEERNTDFPHDKTVFTKDRITSKVKNIRRKYRQAIDSGRQSGGGRVVATFYDICSEIWSGSPATNSILSGK